MDAAYYGKHHVYIEETNRGVGVKSDLDYCVQMTPVGCFAFQVNPHMAHVGKCLRGDFTGLVNSTFVG